jgi:ribosomal protein S18 acetylase RimI-like enzyme
MSLPHGLRMRDATLADLPAIVALREAVGWAAHEWALRYVLEASEARCVVVEGSDAVVGAGSGVSYGPLGVVGNMVVAETHRRQGVGRALLDAVVADLHARGASRLELYATVDGRPLYQGAGFGFIQPGSRVELPRRDEAIYSNVLGALG